MKCFHHNDLDGWCSAYIIRKFWEFDSKPEDFIEMTYDDEFPFDDIKPFEKIYILDYSIKPEEMEKLLKKTPNVIWIDHHITAINKYANFPNTIEGRRQDGLSGCVLTYMWVLSHEIISPLPENVPLPVRFIGDRDTWTLEFGDDTFAFYAGCETLSLDDPFSEDWEKVFNDFNALLEKGRGIETYKAQHFRKYVKAFAYMGTLDGIEANIVNLGMCDSKVWESVEDLKPLQIMYVEKGDTIHVSLRSETIDVSEIAVKHGGGGHVGAAGFEYKAEPGCPCLPWIIIGDD